MYNALLAFYEIIFRPEPEGGYTVIVPALPGCFSFGETLEQAKEMAKEAIELHQEVGMNSSTGVPPVSDEPHFQFREGAYLPHWTKQNGIYSINFRLADSLPTHVLKAWKFERIDIVKTAKHMNRLLSYSEKQRLKELHSKKIERYLASGKGQCWLKHDKIAKTVADAITHFQDQRYALFAWCIMPNHVHVVLKPIHPHSLPDIMHTWKSFTAKEINKILKRKGIVWQPEYYDHLIRSDEELERTIAYVWDNPDVAGLKNRKWRWKREVQCEM